MINLIHFFSAHAKYLVNMILQYALLMTFLSSCVHSIVASQQAADSVAQQGAFTKKLVHGGKFLLTTYEKIQSPGQPLVVYIEGDGVVWRGDMVSSNPTPQEPMLLKLATLDARQNVVYIARPCQYTDPDLNPSCTRCYWTEARLSQEVIFSLNDAINKISQGATLDLIGFSGGGAAVVLIASINPNVRSIVTIAGNLDLVAFDKYHRSLPMYNSLNPIDFTHKVKHIPQLHLSGGGDKVVPAFIAQLFVDKISSKCVSTRIFPGVGHNKGWYEVWPEALKIPVHCKH